MEEEIRNRGEGLWRAVRAFLKVNGSRVFKLSLFLATALAVVLVIPKNHSFKYDYSRGQAWQYDDLTAPFDFVLSKTDEQLRTEREQIRSSSRHYFVYSDTVSSTVLRKYEDNFSSMFAESQGNVERLKKTGRGLLERIMTRGVVSQAASGVVRSRNELVSLLQDNREEEVIFSELYTPDSALEYAGGRLRSAGVSSEDTERMLALFEAVLTPNVSYDIDLTETALSESLDEISPNYGFVARGKLIISQDEPVSDYTYNVLESLRKVYNTQEDKDGFWGTALGYAVVVFSVFLSFYGVLRQFKRGKYFHRKPLLLLLSTMFVSFGLCYIVTRFSPAMIYIVPICLQTIVLRSFFNARIAFMEHIFTVYLCSFMAPNMYMYLFVGLITGVACSFTSNVIYHRSRLFVSVARITGISILVAVGVMLIQNPSFTGEMLSISGYLLISGVLMLFAQPVIYIYEKVFGLVSDISLLELTDTNSPLLRLLSEKAPGTFQHSLAVANIAEQAAREMAGNALLVRVGALYHDVGKLKNPGYFIENQGAHYNPHDALDPRESANIIRRHVSDGLELGRKYGLPSIVTKFIATHHGHSLVYYFWKKAVEMYGAENVSQQDFRYTFGKPVSKEESILMICDSVEAASRSLKHISEQSLRDLITSVVERQRQDGQFDEAEISYRQINRLKEILTEKLLEIYHSRIEYQKD